jgi:hypothetical protein
MAVPAAPADQSIRPWTLRAAAALVSLEALAEALAVAQRGSLTPGLRGLLIACIALKWLFAWRVLHLSAGAVLGLLLLQGTTFVAALGAVDTATPVRIALGGSALTVITLLSASLHAFPTPALPKG